MPASASVGASTTEWRRVETHDWPVIATGAIFWTAAYTASVARIDETSDRMLIPILGPWIEFAGCTGTCRNASRALLAVDGLTQTIGAALVIGGLSLPIAQWAPVPRVAIVPQLRPGGAGMVAMATF